MSHIVIHEDPVSGTRFERFADLDTAVAHLESLHNSDAAGEARLYRLEEIPFEIRSYVKVELGTAASPPAPVADATGPVDVPAVPTDPTDAPPTVEEISADLFGAPAPEEFATAEDLAAMDSIDEALANAPLSNEPRRGLFGR